MKFLWIGLLLLCSIWEVGGQSIDPQQLEQLGFSESEIQEKLLEKGIDLQQVRPDQIGAFQQALQEAIIELELERSLQAATQDSLPPVLDSLPNVAEVPPPIRDTLQTAEPVDSLVPPSPAAIFGQHIFRNRSLEVFDRSKNRKAPDTYVLGPGDAISVSFWGESQRSFSFTINADGYIKPDNLSRIYLSGLQLGQARQLLQRSFQNAYLFRPNEFETTITYARDITINIVGEVEQFGSFTLPATNTAFNALIAAGGPTDIGSVRKIRLIRSGERSRNVDVYRFLLDPGVANDFYLQENDFIHVEVADRVVEIQGAIQRPFRYELIEGEQLLALIKYAGGLKDKAYRENIQITRLQNNGYVILDVNLSQLLAEGEDFTLQNGDLINVKTTPEPLRSYVEIAGAIRFPGLYEFSEGIRVSNLLDKSILEKNARLDIAFVIQTAADSTVSYQKFSLVQALENPQTDADLLLQPFDNVLILSQTDFTDRANILVRGAVRNPNEYPYHKSSLKVADAVLLAGGLRPDATDFAYIHRGNTGSNRPIQYLRIDLENALAQPNSTDNITLLPADTLVVFSRLSFQDEQTVSVRGAVRNPGDFQFDESLSLKDVLTIAGGLKPEAANNRIDIFRLDFQNEESTKTIFQTLEVDADLNVINGTSPNFQLQAADQIVVRQAPEFAIQRNVNILGEVKYPGIYAMTEKNERLLTLIKRAGGLTAGAFPEGATLFRTDRGKGYIILDLKAAMKRPNSDYNYILKDGDIIDIPGKEDLVTIQMKGTQASNLYPAKVISQGKFNVAYQAGKNAKWYIDQHAAGLGKNAKKKWITVEHPNGAIERTKKFLFFKKYPTVKKGSTVSVGVKEKKKKEK
ncbi:MAG: SLBB domain-containing protein, partial [Bacteroidota bacterium]